MNPGEEKFFTLTIGIADRNADVVNIAGKYKNPEVAKRKWQKLVKYWHSLVEQPPFLTTPDKQFNTEVNILLKYQIRTCTSPSTSLISYYYPKIAGGGGIRDTVEDIIALLIIDTTLARKMIKIISSFQYRDCRVSHKWNSITKNGRITGHSDDLLWLPYVVLEFIKETSDYTLLDEEAKYLYGGKGTILKHSLQALDYSLTQLSPRKIPLIKRGDWNDCLDFVGASGKGESIWLGEFLYHILRGFIAILKNSGNLAKAKEYIQLAEEIRAAINNYGWDGEWYIRAFTDSGKPVGSTQCVEGKLYLNPQTWAVISGIAPKERAELCMDSVERFLDTEYGPVLFNPAYTQIDHDIGMITRFAPGTKENGAIWLRPVAWAIRAECILGRGDIAYQFYKKSSTSVLGENAEKYEVEPYVCCEYVDGPGSPNFGTGQFSWLTAAASCRFVAAINWILGARSNFNGLILDPCIPEEWHEFKLKRNFRGTIYDISVKNPQHVFKGIKKIFVDGNLLESKSLPVFEDGNTHLVEVLLGK